MSTKADFAKRLHMALDAKRVERRLAERKRYVARILGVTERQVANYFLGAKLPDPERWTELATAVDVSVDWLMTGRGLMSPLTDDEVKHIETTRNLSPADRATVYRFPEILKPTSPANPPHA